MGIEDDLVAYWFDEVVELFGSQVDLLLAVREEKKKKSVPKYTLEKAIKEVLKQYKRSARKNDNSSVDTLVTNMKAKGITRITM